MSPENESLSPYLDGLSPVSKELSPEENQDLRIKTLNSGETGYTGDKIDYIMEEKYDEDKDKDKDIEKQDKANTNTPNTIEKTDTNSTNSLSLYNKREQIEKFFTSDNGQGEKHTLEESICLQLIGRQNHTPYFYYCKLDSKIENINLKSIKDHIRIKDPERNKSKLLGLFHNKEEEKI